MKIKSVRIQNLRTFADVTVDLDDYLCLAGPNGAGKSTVLCALNIFFRETAHSPVDLTKLEEQDFHKRRTDRPIEITVTFAELNPEAQADFKDYYRNGELVVTARAVFDSVEKQAPVKHFGQRLGMQAFAPFFEALGDGKPVEELRRIYQDLRVQAPELTEAKTKDGMQDRLRKFETEHADRCILLPSEDQFYGFSRGAPRLEKHLQWVYLPAVKDAVSEEVANKNTALEKLLSRVVRSKVNFKPEIQKIREETERNYRELLNQNQPALKEVSDGLQTLLVDYAHPDATCRVEWSDDPDKSIKIDEPIARMLAGEGHFEGGVARFGHGLQRSLLLGLLQFVSQTNTPNGPKLILGIEEPELFQHPPQARHLAQVLQNLSTDGSQVLVSTHSPYFVVGNGFENVRLVRKDRISGTSSVSQATFDQIGDLVSKATGDDPPKRPDAVRMRLDQELLPSRSEIFFAPFVVLVEGIEDIAYLVTHLQITDRWNEFRRLGCHIVECGGKSRMCYPLAILRQLNIPFYAIWDCDGNVLKKEWREKHEKDNLVLLKLVEASDLAPFPATRSFSARHTCWPENLTSALEVELNDQSVWTKLQEEVRVRFGQPAATEKNRMFISDCLVEAHKRGIISSTLSELCERILMAARRHSAHTG